MDDYTKNISDDPVALLELYIARVHQPGCNADIKKISTTFYDVKRYIKELESNNKILRDKLT